MNVLVVIAPATSWRSNRGFRHAVRPGDSRALCGKNAECWMLDTGPGITVPFSEARIGYRSCKRVHDALKGGGT